MTNCRIITVANEKGGTGKTTTCRNLGAALQDMGKRVLFVDLDKQANLTRSVGIDSPAGLTMAIGDLMDAILDGNELANEFILNQNGNEIIPANKGLVATEISLAHEAGGEAVLREILAPLRKNYDYIIIDTGPEMGKLTVNALAACDSVIVPVSPEYWSATGFTDLMDTVSKIKRRVNKAIYIEGILMTMCEMHTILYRDVIEILEECTQGKIRVFDTVIPRSTKVGRANMHSLPILEYEARNPASVAYNNLAREVVHGVSKGSNKNLASA